MSNKVIIGIVSKHYPLEKNKKDTFVRDEVKQAIFDNGAIAIGILPSESEIKLTNDNWEDNMTNIERENLVAQLKLCNGIILQGGLETDNYECWIAKYAYDNDIPILAICAGQNNLVRALGGTTYKISNPEKHNQPNENYVHKIIIDTNSMIYKIIGRTEIMVNSKHKRAVEDSPLLNKVAFCEDGYPDIIETQNKRFYLGVRFHPESLYKIDENMNNIFKSFVSECEKFKGNISEK